MWNKEHLSKPFLSWSVTDLCRTVLSIWYTSYSNEYLFPLILLHLAKRHYYLSESWPWFILCQCLIFFFFQHFREEVSELVVAAWRERDNDFFLEEGEIPVQSRSQVLVDYLVPFVFNEPSLATRDSNATHFGRLPYKGACWFQSMWKQFRGDLQSVPCPALP